MPFLFTIGVLLGLTRVLTERLCTEDVIADHIEAEVQAELTVTEIEYRSTYGSKYLATLQVLNGNDCRVTVALKTDVLSPFSLGDRIVGRFYCTTITNEADREEYNNDLASGVCAYLLPISHGELVLAESGNGGFGAAIEDFRYRLHGGISDAVGDEAGELIGALLLGTRNTLGSDTVRDFRRAGLSHLLALSGLHLMILTGILEKFMRLCRVGKRTRIAILLSFCAVYLVLTGFSFSMLRAVVMLMILQSSFWFGGRYDVFTALCFGGAMIVLVTPGAVFSLSFQMTMLATFGILAFSGCNQWLMQRIPTGHGLPGLGFRLVRVVLSSLAVTLFATIAILPILWLTFGELSLATPLSNLLMIPIITPLLILGLLLLCATALGSAPWLLVAPVRLLSNTMLRITARVSETDCMLSLGYGFVAFIFIPLFAATAILLVVRLKKRLQPLVLLPTLVAVLAFALCLGIHRAVGADQITLSYRTTGNSEGIILVQNSKAVICDLSNGSFTQLSGHYDLLDEQNVCEVEVLMLTHYHARHSGALAKFCNSYRVNSMWLPEPQSAEDAVILADILSVALAENIAVTVYQSENILTVFESGHLTVSPALTDERSTEPALRIDIAYGEMCVRYESAAYSEYARQQGICDGERQISHLILGGHGPRPHEAILPADATALREVWLANDEIVKHHTPLPGVTYVIAPEVRAVLLEN
ncbi:MAG: ComEC/Rec2 family competence protein [Clostridia bacterium]|nr:ComEC/Rec2 family competence protein [Clostridia bacterium]